MRYVTATVLGCLLLSQCLATWAAYGVRIADLSNSPLPANPIRICGRITSASPMKLSDGRKEIPVAAGSLNALTGDSVVATGTWSNGVFTVTGPASVYVSPAGVQMVYVPTGSFQMGNSGVGDDLVYAPHYPIELPQHWVSLSAYYIGKHEVTRSQYRQFINAGGYLNQTYWSSDGWSWKTLENRTKPAYWDELQNWATPPGEFTQTENHPVVGVTYYEAEAFCNWAGGHLPTEARWERAARWTGAHPNVYPWGDAWDDQKCNNQNDLLCYGYQTGPVGSYPAGPSPCGCADMAGNIREWCSDGFKSYPGSSVPVDHPQCRALRGGGWFGVPEDTRCAYRFHCSDLTYSGIDIGFRMAR